MKAEPEDTWKQIHDGIDKDAALRSLSDMDVFVIWKLGLKAWEASKGLGAKFPHE